MTTPNPIIITLATKNTGKQRELEQSLKTMQDQGRLAHLIQLVCNPKAPDVAETGKTFIENALLKARQTPPVQGSDWVLAEDSGLVVEALDGTEGISPFPGIFSNRWLTPARRNELLGWHYNNLTPQDRTSDDGITNTDLMMGILKLMENHSNRAARYCCGMVLYHPQTQRHHEVFESTVLRVSTEQPRGTSGFGYDPIMHAVREDGSVCAQTMAEISMAEKNELSHRGKAFQQIIQGLQKIVGQ
ncbi:MAG: non-canonical purine NTP pyrophosphatase [Cyanobacteria bacterium P01_H01_bin.74]